MHAQRLLTPAHDVDMSDATAFVATALDVPCGFLTLPEELQEAILTYVHRPTDHVSLCLTCKALNTLAKPRLYRRVTVSLSGDPLPHHSSYNRDEFEEDLASPWTFGHSGLEHVRELVFLKTDRHSYHHYSNSARMKALEKIERILDLLPLHGLRQLSVHVNLHWDRRTLLLLLSRQQNLEHLDGLGIQSETRHLPESALSLRNLRMLGLPSELMSLDTLSLYSLLMRDCPKIRQLTLRTRDYRNAGNRTDNSGAVPLLDGPESNGALYNALFEIPFTNHADCLPLRLIELCLQSQRLSYAERSLCKAIDFGRLVYLHLYDCMDADALLGALAARFEMSHGSNLRGFIFDSQTRHSDFTSLEKFLGSFCGLEYLQIRCRQMYAEFNPEVLYSHRESLADLYIGIGRTDQEGQSHWRISMSALSDLTACQEKLNQLAIAFPDVKLNRDCWNDFETALDYIGQSEVEILRILSWPTDVYGRHETHHGDAIPGTDLSGMEAFATGIVRHIASKRAEHLATLKMLITGDSLNESIVLEEDAAYRELTKCAIYLTGIQRDCFGKEQVVAVPVDRDEARYLIPHFDAIVPLSSRLYEDYGLGLGKYKLSTNQPRSYSICD